MPCSGHTVHNVAGRCQPLCYQPPWSYLQVTVDRSITGHSRLFVSYHHGMSSAGHLQSFMGYCRPLLLFLWVTLGRLFPNHDTTLSQVFCWFSLLVIHGSLLTTPFVHRLFPTGHS